MSYLEDRVERIGRLKGILLSGELKTRKEILEELGASQYTLKVLLEGIGARLVPKRYHHYAKIRNAMDNGAKTRKEIAKVTGLSYNTVSIVVKEGAIGNIYLGRIKKTRADRLIGRGLSFGQIAERAGVSRSTVLRYVNISNQREKWRESREGYKNAPKIKAQKEREEDEERIGVVRGLIRSVQDNSLKKLDEDEEWAARKALAVRGRHPFYEVGKLYTIFVRYREAEKREYKLSLEELGEGTGIWFPQVGRFLKEAGLSPLYGKRDRHATPAEKKEAIRRSVYVEMPYLDIDYFLGLPALVVNNNIRGGGLRDKRPDTKPWIKSFGIRSNLGTLNYRLASQVYEAQDLGFSVSETMELLDSGNELVNYALENRGEISDKIVGALEVMYPDRDISKPYRDWKLYNY
ncbi:MAG: hypothetical protein IIA87_00905 [Nanoarchaeota archaeon]|nr:hypothetical protein [Nanoarchaeota archaeon]